MRDQDFGPLSHEAVTKHTGWGDFVEVLRLVQSATQEQYPQLPLLDVDRFVFLPNEGYSQYFEEWDGKRRHPFLLELAQTEDLQPRGLGGFDDLIGRTAFHNTANWDCFGKRDESTTYPEIGLHLISSTVNLAPQTVTLPESPDTILIALNVMDSQVRRHNIGPEHLKEAVHIIMESGCKIMVSGASFSLWVGKKVFSPLFGLPVRKVLSYHLQKPLRHAFIHSLAKELNLPADLIQYQLSFADDFRKPDEVGNTEAETMASGPMQLIRELGFSSNDQILEGFISSDIGLRIVERLYGD